MKKLASNGVQTVSGFGPTIVRHPVPRRLRGLVAGIVGYDEIAPPRGRDRVQPAGSLLLLEISFTAPLLVRELHAVAGTEIAHGAFLAGLMLGPVRTVFFDRHAPVQIYLTPLGAYRLLGVPGRETAGHVTPLADLVPRWERDLPDRLAGAPGWHQRFTIVIDELIQHAGYGPAADALTEWAWAELQRTGGQIRIAALAQRSGWSVRHLSKRFDDVTGISPKGVAQVIRFERIHAELERWSLAELAARHGLSDQSHFSREVRRYAGESPLALARAQRPTAIGTHAAHA
ncbi:helix-turn-helix transcriptional regulator [Arthrobacter sp. A5]|uniref:helix-turn-helix transcriptional regulator n=1 Tax=Arthrobacter sp. A5 TaxID=576926 RepID=UPI003DA83B93